MKYFKHLFDSAAAALVAVFYEDRHADKVIEYYFKNNKKWGKRDRQFIAESVYGCVRWWNLYVHLSRAEQMEPLQQAHRCLAVHLVLNSQDLPEWYQGFFSPSEILKQKESGSLPAHLQVAVPEWLYKLGAEELGEEKWFSSLRALNVPAEVILRCNTLKTTPLQLQKDLAQEGIEAEPIDLKKYPEALRLKKRANVFKSKAFMNGGFEVQDASSQRVGHALAPVPGSRVVDACAGAGGKSLHLAALMENKGRIVSMDTIQWKLDELKKRGKRAGVSVIETRCIESQKTIKRLKDSADYLLLDVPCSGLGVLRRNPDTKWKLRPERLAELREIQQQILQSYSAMVRAGGTMVYSTCSVLPSENEKQVLQFIEKNPQWSLQQDERILPQDSGFDGFYISILKKS